MNERSLSQALHLPRSVSSLGALAAPDQAVEAAQRLYASSRHGLRFCCENREVLSIREAQARDEEESRRRRNRRQHEGYEIDESVAEKFARSAGALFIEDEADDDESERDEWDFDAEMMAAIEEEFEEPALIDC
ncbi:MAG: hypothetical protein R3E83_09380 [Burkholderiaceae bacterium]